MEGRQQFNAGEDEQRPQHQRTDDAPLQDAGLLLATDFEIAEYHDKNEQVVDR